MLERFDLANGTAQHAVDVRRWRGRISNLGAMAKSDSVFAGSIPQVYDKYLVPLIFQSYALDLAHRVAQRRPSTVLEIAAGTGVLTRQLASALPSTVSIAATDLNQEMLDHAAAIGTSRPVSWRQADAMRLPFPDKAFDLVVCQFGVMFFPDKRTAFSEARRVLRPGGVLVFNVWDQIEQNAFADTITNALRKLFPSDPPQFLARVPHGYSDQPEIASDLDGGGFSGTPEVVTLAQQSRADSPRVPAVAYCQGTPLRNEIESRRGSRLAEATGVATAAIAERFGSGTVQGKIQAHIITIER
jgi:ubiquinone/menaquinone biosynthesis C-methylase UbiE